jgi:outer membrane protein TolC
VRIARNQLLPDLDIDGSVGIPTDDDDPTGGFGIDVEELDYSVGVTLSLPLDREIERLNLRAQIIGLEQSIRNYDEFRDGVIVDARSAVRNIDLARFQLRLAERQVEINIRRLEDLELRDDTDPQSVVDAQDELVAAENARDQSLTALRTAVLDYLLQTGQLRVAADGSIEVPPGAGG